MTEHLLIGLTTILALGMTAQWLAWRLRLPAILLLLLFGVVAGPITGLVSPDEIFGDLLFPVVSFSVAIILFEGGLSLKFAELKTVGRVVRNLASVGVVVAWVLCALGAHLIAGLSAGMSILLGAALIVSGPTVIVPLLSHIRPSRDLASVIKWEGIVNDPTGAILAVLVFEVMIAGGLGAGIIAALKGILTAVVAGGVIGALAAGAIVALLRRHLIPDFLKSPLTLMLVVMSYVFANELQTESGLLAVTAMGVALANQKSVSVKQITEFKENLRVLLLAGLFIILAARLPGISALTSWANWLYVAALIIIARPLTVLASTIGTATPLREKVFLSFMAPRGIVAAAISAVFAIRLSEAGFANAEALVPLTFTVIIGTVSFYGLSAGFVARRLRLASPNPQGALIAGAHSWAREIAAALKDSGLETVLIDTNWAHVAAARRSGLNAFYGNALDEDLLVNIPLEGIGRLFAMTPNDEINSLAALHYEDLFGSSEVYQLYPAVAVGKGVEKIIPKHLRGRYLFAEDETFDTISRRFQDGFVVKKTPLTDEFDFDAYRIQHGADALPLMCVTSSNQLKVFGTELALEPGAGDTLISLVRARSEQGS